MSDKGPRTAKEALLAELLGDVDTLLERLEKADQGIRQTVAVLNDADERYRQAVSMFTEQAKAELGTWLDQKATQTVQDMENRLRGMLVQIVDERMASMNEANNGKRGWFSKS